MAEIDRLDRSSNPLGKGYHGFVNQRAHRKRGRSLRDLDRTPPGIRLEPVHQTYHVYYR